MSEHDADDRPDVKPYSTLDELNEAQRVILCCQEGDDDLVCPNCEALLDRIVATARLALRGSGGTPDALSKKELAQIKQAADTLDKMADKWRGWNLPDDAVASYRALATALHGIFHQRSGQRDSSEAK